jgi:hypothetical protein
VVLYHIHSDKASGTIIILLGRARTEVAESSTIQQYVRNISATLQFSLGKRSCFLQLYPVPLSVGKDQKVSCFVGHFITWRFFQRTADGTKTKHESSLMEYSHQVIFLYNIIMNLIVCKRRALVFVVVDNVISSFVNMFQPYHYFFHVNVDNIGIYT